MIYIENDSLNPWFNLACEEYFLKHLDLKEDIVMVWQDDNAIVVGKHQNIIEEINSEYVIGNNVKVARRITGGGAVYHDLGNLNFTFITDVDNLHKKDMKVFSIPVVKALNKMGIKAELSDRNDITIDGKKVSGSAQAVSNNKLLYHGTLLFNSDLQVLRQCLNVKEDKFQSKGVKSVKSRVTNISDHLKKELSIKEFKSLLLQCIFEDKTYNKYKITDQDIERIKTLEKERFSTWDWIYGKSPRCNFRNSKRYSGGIIDVFISLEHGKIEECKFQGDFLDVKSANDIERLLIGKRYCKEEIKDALAKINVNFYFGEISKKQLIACIFDW